MPTIGHLVIGVLIPLLMYYALNKKICFETELYFIAGSVLPDTYTVIKLFIFPDICKYISWNFTHGFIVWIIWCFIFAFIFQFLFQRISKLRLTQIFIILFSAGWLHLGLDMLSDPVRIVGDYYLSIESFYTPFMIMKEQDFITVFYIVFIILPIALLVVEIRKEGVFLGITFETKDVFNQIKKLEEKIEV